MTSPNHTINSLDSEKLILTQYCAKNRLRRTFCKPFRISFFYMTSPNHTINSLDSEKLILTQYCATNRLRRTFMQTLYVIYCLKSSALVLVPPSSNQKHSNLNLWKLTIMITARLIFCLPYSIDILILCLKNLNFLAKRS